MSKEKTFEERFDEFINKLFSRAEIPSYANDVKPPIKAEVRKEILKVIGSFEMEEESIFVSKSQVGRVRGYNSAAKKINSRVKEVRKEYD